MSPHDRGARLRRVAGRSVRRRPGERVVDLRARVADVALAFLRVFLETAAQERQDARREIAWQLGPVRLAVQDRADRVGDRLARERRPSGEQLVEHAAERPDVRAFVHGAAARLLRAHVGRGAEDQSGHGRRRP